MHLRRCREQAVDGRQWVGHVEPTPFLRDAFVDVEDASCECEADVFEPAFIGLENPLTTPTRSCSPSTSSKSCSPLPIWRSAKGLIACLRPRCPWRCAGHGRNGLGMVSEQVRHARGDPIRRPRLRSPRAARRVVVQLLGLCTLSQPHQGLPELPKPRRRLSGCIPKPLTTESGAERRASIFFKGGRAAWGASGFVETFGCG